MIITGPDKIKANEADFLAATVMGAMLLYGGVTFYWYVDANGDNWPQAEETLSSGVVTADLHGQAQHKALYAPTTNWVGQVVVVSVQARVYSPGYNLAQEYLDAKKSVTVIR